MQAAYKADARPLLCARAGLSISRKTLPGPLHFPKNYVRVKGQENGSAQRPISNRKALDLLDNHAPLTVKVSEVRFVPDAMAVGVLEGPAVNYKPELRLLL